VNDDRCADVSRAAGEPLAATAATAERWLLVEVSGTWPRDVADEGPLPDVAREAVSHWLAGTPRSRLQFVRRPGQSALHPVVFVVRAEETVAEIRRIELADHEELARVDLETDGDVSETPLVLVCGHGTRDACCARRGTEVFGVLSRALRRPEDLWISSHQAGHRFAANVLVLPAGLQFGRVEPDEARSLVSRALAGTIELGRYRGRTCYAREVQAAEHAVREAANLEGVSDLHLAGVEGPLVRFRARNGTAYGAVVEKVEGPTIPASCGADPEPQKVFTARIA
jgi:hypothetical protein